VVWPKDFPWLGQWEQELLTFPDSRHDDQADTFACATLEATHHPSHDAGALAQALSTPNYCNE
jgi:phage terminase large subunit-like protein